MDDDWSNFGDLIDEFSEQESEDNELVKCNSTSTDSMWQDISEGRESAVNFGHLGGSGPSRTKKFDLLYLQHQDFFLEKLFANTEINERRELFAFLLQLQDDQFDVGARTMRKIVKQIFGKDYLKGVGLKPAQIRYRLNMLEMKFFAVACRYLIIKENFSMSKGAFLERIQPVLISFCSSTSGNSSSTNSHRLYCVQLMSNDFELELLFRFLSPLLILEKTECSGAFFRRKSGLLLTLGEFMEFSGRQYTSGGGKTLATRLREACMDIITGNKRQKRNR